MQFGQLCKSSWYQTQIWVADDTAGIETLDDFKIIQVDT